MGAIVCSVKSFLDTIIDIVGIKSGIVLSRTAVVDILRNRDADFDWTEAQYEQGMRIRSETYEDLIRYVRISIGNLKPEMQHPFLWAERLIALDKEGHQAFAVLKAFSEVSRKYPGQKIDPNDLIKDILIVLPGTPIALIIGVIQIWIDHQQQSHHISKPEEEEWDGGTLLDQLFNCEIKSSEKFMDQKFLDYISANTEKIQVMHWRNFERFCAEFFDRLGYHIQLGPGGNDGGIDIRAFDPMDSSKPLIIIQCKRYKEGHQVGIETVKAFYTDVTFEQAELGMIITTSEIAPGGKKVCEARKYPLSFAELEDVKKWAKMMSKHD